MLIHDPTTHRSVFFTECEVLEPIDGITPVRTQGGNWFGWHPTSNRSYSLTVDVLEAIADLEGKTGQVVQSIADEFCPLDESVDDPNSLKAVFVMGSPGSGKGMAVAEMFAGSDFKIVNQDAHLERMLAKAGLAQSQAGALGWGAVDKARNLAGKERDQYANQRLGLVIDGTGWNYARVANPVQQLRKLGYDCYGVIVNVSLPTALKRNAARAATGGRGVPVPAVQDAYAGLAGNGAAYKKLFGTNKLFVVSNEADVAPAVWKQTAGKQFRAIARQIMARPVSNSVGRAWRDAQLNVTVPTPAPTPDKAVSRQAARKKARLAGAGVIESTTESVDDPNSLKAVFLCGSGGSGKSSAAIEMFAGSDFKFVNSDAHLERMFKNAGLSMDNAAALGNDARDKAKALADKQKDAYSSQRLGLLIDGTGKTYPTVALQVNQLRKLGYDCYCVVVYVKLSTALRRNHGRASQGGRGVPQDAIAIAHAGLTGNLDKYKRLFGTRNYFILSNDDDLAKPQWTATVGKTLRGIASQIKSRPVVNAVGRAWRDDKLGNTVFNKNLAGVSESDAATSPSTIKTWYHGSPVSIEKFDYGHVGQGHDQDGPGFYFTSVLKDAMQYAYPNGFVHTVELSPRRVLKLKGPLPANDLRKLAKMSPKFDDVLTDWDENPTAAFKTAMTHVLSGTGPADAFQNVWYTFYRYVEADYLKNMVKLGYDAAYNDPQSHGYQHIVVFNPDVIKITATTPVSALSEAPSLADQFATL